MGGTPSQEQQATSPPAAAAPTPAGSAQEPTATGNGTGSGKDGGRKNSKGSGKAGSGTSNGRKGSVGSSKGKGRKKSAEKGERGSSIGSDLGRVRRRGSVGSSGSGKRAAGQRRSVSVQSAWSAWSHGPPKEEQQRELRQVLASLKKRQTGMLELHTSFACDRCRMDPLVGPRFHCLQCRDYDLCISCINSAEHNGHGHRFERARISYRPAHVAAQLGDLDALKVLRRHGHDMAEVMYDQHGLMPIHLAAATGQLHVLAWLIDECGVSPHSPSRHLLPIHVALYQFQVSAARLLQRACSLHRQGARTTCFRSVGPVMRADIDADLRGELLQITVDTPDLSVTPFLLVRLALSTGEPAVAQQCIEMFNVSRDDLEEQKNILMADAMTSGKAAAVLFVARSGLFGWDEEATTSLTSWIPMGAERSLTRLIHFDLDLIKYLVERMGVVLTDPSLEHVRWLETGRVRDLEWMFSHMPAALDHFRSKWADAEEAFTHRSVLQWLIQHDMPIRMKSLTLAAKTGTLDSVRIVTAALESKHKRSIRSLLRDPPEEEGVQTPIQLAEQQLEQARTAVTQMEGQQTQLQQVMEQLEGEHNNQEANQNHQAAIGQVQRILDLINGEIERLRGVVQQAEQRVAALQESGGVVADDVTSEAVHELVVAAARWPEILEFLLRRKCFKVEHMTAEQRCKVLIAALQRRSSSAIRFLVNKLDLTKDFDTDMVQGIMSHAFVMDPEEFNAVTTYHHAKFLLEHFLTKPAAAEYLRTDFPTKVRLASNLASFPGSLRSMPLLRYALETSPIAPLFKQRVQELVASYSLGLSGHLGYPYALQHMLSHLSSVQALHLSIPRTDTLVYIWPTEAYMEPELKLRIRPTPLRLPPAISSLPLRLFKFSSFERGFPPISLDALSSIATLELVSVESWNFTLPAQLLTLPAMQAVASSMLYWQQNEDTDLTDLTQALPLPKLSALARAAFVGAGGVITTDAVPAEVVAVVEQQPTFACLVCEKPGWDADQVQFVARAADLQGAVCGHPRHSSATAADAALAKASPAPHDDTCALPGVRKAIRTAGVLPMRVRVHSWCWQRRSAVLTPLAVQVPTDQLLHWGEELGEECGYKTFSREEAPTERRGYITPGQEDA